MLSISKVVMLDKILAYSLSQSLTVYSFVVAKHFFLSLSLSLSLVQISMNLVQWSVLHFFCFRLYPKIALPLLHQVLWTLQTVLIVEHCSWKLFIFTVKTNHCARSCFRLSTTSHHKLDEEKLVIVREHLIIRKIPACLFR